jgi:hypothetical protein
LTKSKIFTILIAAMLFGLSAGEGTAIADQPVGPSRIVAVEPSPILATRQEGPKRAVVAIPPVPVFTPDRQYIRDLAQGEMFTIICGFYDVTQRRFTELMIDDVAGVSGRAIVPNRPDSIRSVTGENPFFVDDCNILA